MSPIAKIRYKESDMILKIHLDASYLGPLKANSCTAGHFFLAWLPQDKQQIKLNGPLHVFTSLLQFVATSALLVNATEGKIIHLILQEMGHFQPPKSIPCDYFTATGIEMTLSRNNTLNPWK